MTQLSEQLRLIVSAGVLIVSLVLGLLARRLLLAPLSRLVKKTPWTSDEALVASLRRPLPVWSVLMGLYVVMKIVVVPAGWAPVLKQILLSGFILSVTLWAANLVARLLYLGGTSGGGAPTATSATGIVRNIARISVIVVGGLVFLSNLGISVTPVVTTAGLAGLAVALGLQNTFSNLIAGMEITLEANIRVGDFVKLESGEEGYVDDIQWRTTRVKTLLDNAVLIPNGRLVDSVVTNYHVPSHVFGVLVRVAVHPASDLERVERVACEVGREVMKTVPGGVPDFTPFLRYSAFGDSTIDFSVFLRARASTDNFLIKHEFIKALKRAFAAEGIAIPPTPVLRLEQ